MVLKQAFNALTRLHSRPATLKRLGKSPAPDIYSPARVTPSNYFRHIQGPSDTVVKGREFIIPVDTLLGQQIQKVSFLAVPTEGEWALTYDGEDTTGLAFDANAAAIQAALRAIEELEAVTVTGDYTAGFLVTMVGVDSPLLLVKDEGDIDTTITIATNGYAPMSPLIKRGDRIIDSILGGLSINEVEEICDIGGAIMGFRCRVE